MAGTELSLQQLLRSTPDRTSGVKKRPARDCFLRKFPVMVERLGDTLYRVIGHMADDSAVVEVVLLRSESTLGVETEAVLLLMEEFVFHYWCEKCRNKGRHHGG